MEEVVLKAGVLGGNSAVHIGTLKLPEAVVLDPDLYICGMSIQFGWSPRKRLKSSKKGDGRMPKSFGRKNMPTLVQGL